MASSKLIIALATVAASLPVSAGAQAPAAPAAARYCMRVEAETGTRIESVQCWTRDEWASLGVNVDVDWPKEGVRILA